MEMTRKPTESQQKQFLKNKADILKILGQTSSAPSEIKKKTGLSYATIRKHLKILIHNGDAKEYNGKFVSLELYFKLVGDTMKAYTKELQKTLASMSKPESIWRWQKEGTPSVPKRLRNREPSALPEMFSFTKEEWKEFHDHKKMMFGGLRRVFFELACILVKADFALKFGVEDDLSNVVCHFENGEPFWICYPKEVQRPWETDEEFKARLEERDKWYKECGADFLEGSM
jgi:hypothetical protein